MSVVLKLGDRWAQKEVEIRNLQQKLIKSEQEQLEVFQINEKLQEESETQRKRISELEELLDSLGQSHEKLERSHATLQEQYEEQEKQVQILQNNLETLHIEDKNNLQIISDQNQKIKEQDHTLKLYKKEIAEMERVCSLQEKKSEDLKHKLQLEETKLELERKSKEQKERHLAVIVKEKEKLWRQVEETEKKKKCKKSKTIPLKPIIIQSSTDQDAEMRRYAKLIDSMTDKLEEKEKETARLEKEIYNLKNRLRNIPTKQS